MKKFEFTLDTVLNYKQQVFDGVRNEYAIITDKVSKQEKRLDNVNNQYKSLNQKYNEQATKGISVAWASSFSSGLRVLEKDIKREEHILEGFKREADIKQDEMIEAKKETQTLEKLKENRLEDYNKMVQKNDELAIDQLVSMRRI